MSKFVSINYTRVTCKDCGAATTIEPGKIITGLNCTCEDESQEVADQYKEIKVFTDGENTVEALGVFKNGDIEVKHVDGTLSYRVPAATFTNQYHEVQDEDPTTNPQMDDVSEESDPSNTVTLSLEDLKGKTEDEVKDEYNMDELRVLAKASKIRGATQMNEDKLVGKLLAKAE